MRVLYLKSSSSKGILKFEVIRLPMRVNFVALVEETGLLSISIFTSEKGVRRGSRDEEGQSALRSVFFLMLKIIQ